MSDITLKVDDDESIIRMSGCRIFRCSTDRNRVSDITFAKQFKIGENVDIKKITGDIADVVLRLNAPKKAPTVQG